MRPNIISKPKEKHLNWGENESSIKRVFVFLQTESWVCTWDLNQGTRLQNHPGREGCVKLHRSREEIPCSKDRGVKKEWMKKQNGRVKMTVMRELEIQAHTHTMNLYSLKPFQHKVTLHRQCGKQDTTWNLSFNLTTSSWDPLDWPAVKSDIWGIWLHFINQLVEKQQKRVWFMFSQKESRRWGIPWLPLTADMPGHVERDGHFHFQFIHFQMERRQE